MEGAHIGTLTFIMRVPGCVPGTVRYISMPIVRIMVKSREREFATHRDTSSSRAVTVASGWKRHFRPLVVAIRRSLSERLYCCHTPVLSHDNDAGLLASSPHEVASVFRTR